MEVVCHRATALPAADANGLSDPYLALALVTGSSKPLTKEKGKTSVVTKSLSPEWNSTVLLGTTTAGRRALIDLLARAASHPPAESLKLQVKVLDHKGLFDADDVMCACEIDLQPLAAAAMSGERNGAPEEVWYPLRGDGRETLAGKVLLSVSFERAIVTAAEEALAIAAQRTVAEAIEQAAEQAAADAAEALDRTDDAHAEEFRDKPPNELHITLISGRGLLVMDKVNKFCKCPWNASRHLCKYEAHTPLTRAPPCTCTEHVQQGWLERSVCHLCH